MSQEDPSEDNWDDENSRVAVVSIPTKMRLHGCYIKPPNSEFYVESPRKRQKFSVDLRESLTDPKFIEKFNKCWKKQSLQQNQVELLNKPFVLSIVQNLVYDTGFTQNLLEEIYELDKWRSFSTDLLKNVQSVEFQDIEHSTHLQMFYHFLKTDVKCWLERVTGGEYDDEISAIISMYRDTDYLLLHDDRQEKRAIAYVFYITGPRPWKPEYGGSLQLFDMTENKKVRDIYPADNQFVFFEVSNQSGHQVGEVTTKNECRISINGWFHYKNPPVFEKPILEVLKIEKREPEVIAVALNEWINSIYLDEENISCIQGLIETESEVSLVDYFLPEKFNAILESLRSHQMRWVPKKPINSYCYDVAVEAALPGIVRDYVNLFGSSDMFELLAAYTELQLSYFRYELQRWNKCSYSLMTDSNVASKENELEVIIFFGSENGKIIGGDVVYIAKADFAYQEALLTIKPTDNCLNVVYKDSPRFIKYVSNYSTAIPYYVLICSYFE